MKKILILDDDKDFLNIVRKFLAPEGYDVLGVEATRSAELILKTFVFDLILVDLHIAKESGFDFLKNAKPNSLNSTTPVIMLTGDKEFSNVEKAAKLGVKGYLVKPITCQQLIEKVKSCIAI